MLHALFQIIGGPRTRTTRYAGAVPAVRSEMVREINTGENERDEPPEQRHEHQAYSELMRKLDQVKKEIPEEKGRGAIERLKADLAAVQFIGTIRMHFANDAALQAYQNKLPKKKWWAVTQGQADTAKKKLLLAVEKLKERSPEKAENLKTAIRLAQEASQPGETRIPAPAKEAKTIVRAELDPEAEAAVRTIERHLDRTCPPVVKRAVREAAQRAKPGEQLDAIIKALRQSQQEDTAGRLNLGPPAHRASAAAQLLVLHLAAKCLVEKGQGIALTIPHPEQVKFTDLGSESTKALRIAKATSRKFDNRLDQRHRQSDEVKAFLTAIQTASKWKDEHGGTNQ